MTKKDYELIEQTLQKYIVTVMKRPLNERAQWSKVDLQDLVHDFVVELEKRDPKFKRQDFYYKSGALNHLQN